MKRTALPILAALAAVAVVGLLVYGISARSDDHSLDDAVAHGQLPAAPDRRLPLLGSAGQHRLADYRGQVVVLNVWASWCEPCRAEAPLLERIQSTLIRHRGTILGLTYRDTTPDSVAFMREFHLSYPSLRDVDGKLAQAYGTKALPETFVLDRSGRVAALSRGQVDQAFLDRAVALAERT
ncbi:MAG TPA: TlpA disulfide reductase family protein [Solirubrobacteraceae bacterium]|nr:TlpA disulfide reductase family protein [Solirubrobacteraceae bacterium]